MIKISHRGNINGPSKNTENNPKQITKVLEASYDCEIDVWYVNGKLILAHSLQEDINYTVNDDFLKKGFVVSCKKFGCSKLSKKLKCKFFLA